jgi:hypothetical protein
MPAALSSIWPLFSALLCVCLTSPPAPGRRALARLPQSTIDAELGASISAGDNGDTWPGWGTTRPVRAPACAHRLMMSRAASAAAGGHRECRCADVVRNMSPCRPSGRSGKPFRSDFVRIAATIPFRGARRPTEHCGAARSRWCVRAISRSYRVARPGSERVDAARQPGCPCTRCGASRPAQ